MFVICKYSSISCMYSSFVDTKCIWCVLHCKKNPTFGGGLFIYSKYIVIVCICTTHVIVCCLLPFVWCILAVLAHWSECSRAALVGLYHCHLFLYLLDLKKDTGYPRIKYRRKNDGHCCPAGCPPFYFQYFCVKKLCCLQEATTTHHYHL